MSGSKVVRPAWAFLLSYAPGSRAEISSVPIRSILHKRLPLYKTSTISTSCRTQLPPAVSIPFTSLTRSRTKGAIITCPHSQISVRLNHARSFTSSPLIQRKVEEATQSEAKESIEVRKDEQVPQEQDRGERQISEEHHENDHHLDEFGRSEKASKAAQINLSARLKKDPGANSGFSGFKDIWRLLVIAKPEAKWLAAAFLFLLVSSAISMSIPFSIGKILDVATQNTPGKIFGLDMNHFYFALGGVLCIGAMANYGRIIILRIVGERIVSRLRSQLFRRTYTQDAEFFDANRVGDLISRLSSDTIIVGKSVTQNISDGLRALVTGGAGLVMMGYTSLSLTGIMSLMIPPIAVGAFFYGRNIRNLSRKIQRAIGSATKVAEERLSNVRTSQAFAGERLEVGRYNNEVRSIFKLGVREALVSATFFSTTGLAGNATILAILVFGSQQVQSGAISIGQLSSFLMYTAYAGSSLFGLSSFYSELMKGVGAASRLFELQDRTPALSATKGQRVKSAKGVIKFEDVGFSYPTRPAVAIFEGLSFSIPQGTNVAVVGNSGGGKSTISSLLLRFYSPTSGRILIDNVDLATMNIKSLRRRIGVVAQEPVLFSGSIAENIAYGKPNASRQDIISAAKRANCDFIGDFPDGLDTNVGARGLMLSGGQRQRIAIARALVKDPDVLILDEATSALDAESETLVNEALNKLMQGAATTISIAHRLSTIKRSDYIIVLGQDGRVAEQGTFKELSNRAGAFRRLMESQLGARPDLKIPLPENFPEMSEHEADEMEMEREAQQAEEEELDEEVQKGKEEEDKAAREQVKVMATRR